MVKGRRDFSLTLPRRADRKEKESSPASLGMASDFPMTSAMVAKRSLPQMVWADEAPGFTLAGQRTRNGVR